LIDNVFTARKLGRRKDICSEANDKSQKHLEQQQQQEEKEYIEHQYSYRYIAAWGA
jgi:hypothetical protein